MIDHREEIDTLNNRSWNTMLEAPEEALGYANRALVAAEQASYEKGIADAELNKGWCDSYLCRQGPAIICFQKALDTYTQLGDEMGVMKALNALGVSYQDLGRYDRAMDYYTRSLEEARKRGNRWREAVTLNNIGEVCLELGELKEALDYFLRAYEIVPDDGEAELSSNVLLNIGTTFYRMENWPLAREFTEKALVIADEARERVVEAQCWLALGSIERSSDRLELAETNYLKALTLSAHLKNERQHIEVLLELGSLYAQRGEAARALERYRDALSRAEAAETKSLIHQAYEKLSTAYEGLGDYKTALDYYRRFSRYEREVLNEDISRKIKNITVQYEVEKSRQEAEIYRLRNIELKEKTDELEIVNKQILSIQEMGRKITSSLDLDTVFATLYESLYLNMDLSVFGIALFDSEADSLDWRHFVHQGTRLHRDIQRLDDARSYAAWCIRNRKSIFIRDGDVEYKNFLNGERIAVGEHSQSLVFIPLTIENRVIGVLTVQSYVKSAYTEQHRLLLEALAPYIAIAMENGLIHDRLEELNRAILGEKAELEQAAVRIIHLANHDSLTGLPNRRLLFELLQKSFDIASRSGTKVGLIYVDLDNFKPINDRFGHSAGDRALVCISDRLKLILRSSDTVARVGGDEFIAVLTNVNDRDDIELAARKIIEEIGKPLTIDSSECHVGISMGIAVYPDDGQRIEDLVKLADAAMYLVKHDQKNNYRFATSPKSDSGSAQAPTFLSRS